MDFEDLLERAIEAFDDEHVQAEFRERYHAFTVDEYQDVNLLQQTLLERGSASATTSAWSATTTSRSTGSPARRPSTCSAFPSGPRSSGSRRTTARRRRCWRLRTGSCRSSAAPRRRCARRGPTGRSRRSGPSPRRRPRRRTSSSGSAAPAARSRRWRVLFRTNARLGRLRGGAAEAGIPFQGAALLTRDAARQRARAARPDGATGRRAVRAIAARPRLARRSPPEQARRARGDAAGGPAPPRAARGGARRDAAPSSSRSCERRFGAAARHAAACTC